MSNTFRQSASARFSLFSGLPSSSPPTSPQNPLPAPFGFLPNPKNFHRLITSPTFKFHVHDDDTNLPQTVYAHVDAIANLSAPLSTLLRGGWKEAEQGEVTLEGVSTSTFAQIVEYAYTGYYHVEGPVKEAQVFSDFTSSFTAFSEPFGFASGRYSNQNHPQAFPTNLNTSTRAREKFMSLTIGGVSLNSGFRSSPFFKEPDQDHTPVFLSHARMYLFATQWQVHDLRVRAITKLYRALRDFQSHPCRTKDVIKLVRLLYLGDESSRDLPTAEGDEMRDLVCLYVASEITSFKRCAAFHDLVNQGGPFCVELLGMVVREVL